MEFLFLAVLILMMMTMLGVGYPVAFALPGSAIITISLAAVSGWLFFGDAAAFFVHGSASEWLGAGVTNFRGVYWEAERDTLIAIPLFIFMGIMLQRSKIAEELLVTMAKLFGGLPGGLGISVVVVGALLGATTGIVGATVVAMGLISLPAMMRHNYSQPLATGTIMASGTLGQIIPPSIVLIILADQLSSAVDRAGQLRLEDYKAATGEIAMPSEFSVIPTSAGDLFMGALLPSAILIVLYIIFIMGYALLRPKNAPAVPVEGKMDRAFWFEVFFAIVPPLLLIVLVLGSIITGVTTVTQAGAVGAVGAAVMAGYKLHQGPRRYWPAIITIACLAVVFLLHRSFNLNFRQLASPTTDVGVIMAVMAVLLLLVALSWSAFRIFRIDDTLRTVMIDTAKMTSLVFIILLGASMLIAAFRAFGGEILVKDFLTGLPGGFWVQFFVVMAVIYVLGFFIDYIEISIVVVPIVAPILLMNPEANITAIWLGVMIGLNIQTSFLTPPFGFALFYLRGVASSAIKTINMYKGVIPFIALQLLALVMVAFNPQLVNYLPSRISLLSETAPPPRSPALQYCVEEMLVRDVPVQRDRVLQRLQEIRAVTDALPAERRDTFEQAAAGYERSFALLSEFNSVSGRISAATPDYRPLHQEVSKIRREMSRLDSRIELLRQRMKVYRGDEPEAVAGREQIEAQIAEIEASKASSAALIPDSWDGAHSGFLALLKEEQNARMNFRRTSQQSYTAIRDLVLEIDASSTLEDFAQKVESLIALIGSTDTQTLETAFVDLESRIGAVPGAQSIRGALSSARRNLARSPDDARQGAAAVADQIRQEASWRAAAKPDLLPPLAALEAETRNTLGLLEQPRLERPLALEVASCMAHHRDISLRF